jgi:parallel beta-helix repeat protein
MSTGRDYVASVCPLSTKGLLRGIGMLVLGLTIGLLPIEHSAAAAPTLTIKVNTTADNNASDNVVSLREALLLVNGGTGGDGTRSGLGRPLSANETAQIVGGTVGTVGVAANIVFTDLPGLSTIALTGGTGSPGESLPPIMTSEVVVDGTDAVGGRVTIDGSGAPATSNVLWLGWTDTVSSTQVSSITIRSLVVTGAKQYGILLNPARESLISHCDVSHAASFAIFIQGRYGNADGNIVEDCTVGDNQSLGIVINRPNAFSNIIRNNRIGTNAAGTTAAPNTGAGIAVFTGAHDNVITGNLISGNTLQGIYFSGTAALPVNANVVRGNRIGTAANGTSALPNVQGIVFDDFSRNNVVGGTAAGQANTIAFNTQSGIVVVGNNTLGNRFSRNSIFQNGILGIDLLDDKLPTAGISGGGLGPNEQALRPTQASARVRGSFAVVAGTASPNSTIELFVSDGGPSGFGSGKTYCASTTAGAGGAFRFAGLLSCVPGSARLTATSTLVDGSTSEFGNNLATSPAPPVFLPQLVH